MVKYISRYGRYLTKICQNYGQDGAFQKCDKKSLGIKWKSMSTLTICHWHWDKMSANQSDQTLRAQSGSRPFAVKGRSSSFHPFFQDCVRGQHLCLAQVERSSSHTKTGVCSHFFSVSPQTTCNCVVGFLKKCLQHPFAPTLLRRACTWVSPFANLPISNKHQTSRRFKL